MSIINSFDNQSKPLIDLSEYFEETIQNGGYVSANIRPGFVYSIKKIPEDLVINIYEWFLKNEENHYLYY